MSQSKLNNTERKQNKFIATNGIDMPIECKKYLANEGLQFLYIGRLDVYYKGLDLLINAVGQTTPALNIIAVYFLMEWLFNCVLKKPTVGR